MVDDLKVRIEKLIKRISYTANYKVDVLGWPEKVKQGKDATRIPIELASYQIALNTFSSLYSSWGPYGRINTPPSLEQLNGVILRFPENCKDCLRRVGNETEKAETLQRGYRNIRDDLVELFPEAKRIPEFFQDENKRRA